MDLKYFKIDFIKETVREHIVDILGITLGSIMCGIGYSIFLVPFKASPGGVAGLAQILFYSFNLPLGVSLLMFNIPLLLIGILVIGKGFGAKTILAIFLQSVFSDLFSYQVLSKFKYLIKSLYF